MNELLRPVLSEESYRVGSALSAVPHHLRIELAAVHHGLPLGRRGRAHIGERGSFHRDEREDVHDIRSERLDLLHEDRYVLVVDPGDHDDVDLDGHPQFGAQADPLLLTVEEGQGALLS